MVESKKTSKSIYILGVIGGLLLLIAIFFIVETNKPPYENYEDNVYLHYKIVYKGGKNNYVIDEHPVAVHGQEFPKDKISIWKEKQQFYIEVFNEKTLSIEYELAFTANLYNYNGNVFIRLNEVDIIIPNLTIKD